MKFVTSRELRMQPGKVRKELSRGEIVVTSRGQPIALITKVTPETLERELAHLRRARALAALEEIQREAARTGRDRLGDEEIETEIRAARKARRR